MTDQEEGLTFQSDLHEITFAHFLGSCGKEKTFRPTGRTRRTLARAGIVRAWTRHSIALTTAETAQGLNPPSGTTSKTLFPA